eukprot:scaffold3626_cov69-Skeletonema_dohrnii-CCMP3373.AAC.5
MSSTAWTRHQESCYFVDGWTPIHISDYEKGDETKALKARLKKLRCALQQVELIFCTPPPYFGFISLPTNT